MAHSDAMGAYDIQCQIFDYVIHIGFKLDDIPVDKK